MYTKYINVHVYVILRQILFFWVRIQPNTTLSALPQYPPHGHRPPHQHVVCLSHISGNTRSQWQQLCSSSPSPSPHIHLSQTLGPATTHEVWGYEWRFGKAIGPASGAAWYAGPQHSEKKAQVLLCLCGLMAWATCWLPYLIGRLRLQVSIWGSFKSFSICYAG